MRNRVSLIIDNNEEDQRFLTIAMVQVDAHIDCVSAKSGKEALGKLRKDPAFIPDYIFLSLDLPGKDARQTLVELKKIERLRHVPVVVLSAPEEKGVQEMIELGAWCFTVKPDTISKWVQLLMQLVNSSSLDRDILLSTELY
ncbi:response regulator [Telluribacter humicola]|uniref:response regulator n=1 Tax=Telluribacter humicola TaxID=1720261 RepID=UPI001A965313|nr:response regulator [Telluribacter humicola]